MPNEEQRRFIDTARVARLATADASGQPHVIPVCFAGDGDTVYIAVDEKPKRRPGAPLQRERNLLENPRAALVIDHYEEDWQQLGWVLLRGTTELLRAGQEVVRAHRLLRAKYSQYAAMRLEGLPVIALRVQRTVSWGRLV